MHHLKTSAQKCLRVMQAILPRLVNEVVASLDAEDASAARLAKTRGEWKTKAKRTALKFHGPRIGHELSAACVVGYTRY
jgi:hypothetical protein